jgi:hypothetical protein
VHIFILLQVFVVVYEVVEVLVFAFNLIVSIKISEVFKLCSLRIILRNSSQLNWQFARVLMRSDKFAW